MSMNKSGGVNGDAGFRETSVPKPFGNSMSKYRGNVKSEGTMAKPSSKTASSIRKPGAKNK